MKISLKQEPSRWIDSADIKIASEELKGGEFRLLIRDLGSVQRARAGQAAATLCGEKPSDLEQNVATCIAAFAMCVENWEGFESQDGNAIPCTESNRIAFADAFLSEAIEVVKIATERERGKAEKAEAELGN